MFLDTLHHLMRKPRRWAARALENATSIGAAIVWPIEWLFAATAGRAMHVAEKFEHVEDWLFGLWRLITWPVRIVWRLLVGLLLLLAPAPVRAAINRRLDGWFRFTRWVGQTTWQLVEWFNLDAATRWIAWATQPAWRPVAALGGFLHAWLATRPYKEMLWGGPAIALVLPLAAIVVWGLVWGQSSVEAHYRAAVETARDNNDLAAVDLFNRKLLLLGADTQNTEYRRALALAKDDKLAAAYAAMKRLASEEKLGHPDAHVWILLNLLNGQLDEPEDERLRIAGVHLQHLETLNPNGSQLKLLRAVWLGQSGRLEEAAAMFEPLTSSNLLAAMQRMQINLQLKRLDDARSDARALRIHLEAAERAAEPLGPPEYQAWAQAEQLLDNRPQWARIVRAWLKSDPENKAARQNVVALDLLEFNEMLQTAYPNAEALAAHLVEIAELAEDTTPLENRLMQLYANRAQVPGVAAMFGQLIESPDTPLSLAAALGAAAASENDVPLARRLLGRVVVENPKHAVAWNNYAWALSREPDPDLPQALDAVNRALELVPDEFRFRETRGQILIALQRWQEAVDDLEFALNGMPDVQAIHASLATAYEHLGQTDLAAIHRQQVQ